MSSIYRKGRDGYFYYQTYVYNKKTKKKDKRIFHSLGTKDKDTASKKKIELDSIYENKVVGHLGLQNLVLKKRIYSLLTFGVLASIFFLFYNQLIIKDSVTVDDKIEVYDEIKSLPTTFKEEIQIVDVKDSIYNAEVEYEKTLDASDKIEELEIKKIINSKYSIIRSIQISEKFNQGQVYVTINKNVPKESIKLISNKIREEYKQFTNIIICFYSDDEIGLSIAKGFMSNSEIKSDQNVWLAMYSYNSVEGEYFDDAPGGYSGAY